MVLMLIIRTLFIVFIPGFLVTIAFIRPRNNIALFAYSVAVSVLLNMTAGLALAAFSAISAFNLWAVNLVVCAVALASYAIDRFKH